MTTYLTADLHLGHTNIIKYSRRPFEDVNEMNEIIVRDWNTIVQPDDVVWILGDLCLGRIEESLEVASRLAGQKILVPGNHDRMWPFAKQGTKEEFWRKKYLEAGFVATIGLIMTMWIADRDVIVSHLPYQGDSHDEDRWLKARPVDNGLWNIHGHIHNNGWRVHGRMLNVGLDAWGGRLVTLEEVEAIINAGETELECLEWKK